MTAAPELLWTLLALSYCLAGVYLRAFDTYDHPYWIWGSFIFVGTSLFMLINHQHLLGDLTAISRAFEVATIISAGVMGHTLFVAARTRAKAINDSQTFKEEVEEYREIIDRHDIDIRDDPEQ